MHPHALSTCLTSSEALNSYATSMGVLPASSLRCLSAPRSTNNLTTSRASYLIAAGDQNMHVSSPFINTYDA